MYPFNVVLVGLTEPITQGLKTALAARDAELECELPSATSVVDRFVDETPAPRLLVVYEPTDEIAASVRLLRDRFTNWPIIALVQITGDSAGVLAANRGGADQVVNLPLSALDFGEALDRLALRYRPARNPNTVIAVSGVVPGAGATTIAATLAGELAAAYSLETLLVEATLQMGVLAMHLNVKPSIHLTDLLADADKLDIGQLRKVLTRVAPRLNLLAASPDLTRSVPRPAHDFLKVVELARKTAEVVVIDLPCTYDDVQFETLWSVDQIVLVGDQSLPAVRTSRMILDAAMQAKAVKRIHVVVNKYDPAIVGLTAEKISDSLGGDEVLIVPNDYAEVMCAANEGRLLRDFASDSPVVLAIRELAKVVMGKPVAKPHGSRFLTRLRELFYPTDSAR